MPQNNRISIEMKDLKTNNEDNQIVNQRLRRSSVGSVSVNRVNVKAPTLTKQSSSSAYQKMNLDPNVTVVKVSKQSK
jgi:isocitrate dehydrogenase